MTKYSVHQQPLETLLNWITAGEIAIPEIQRPLVWKAAKVRDLIMDQNLLDEENDD